MSAMAVPFGRFEPAILLLRRADLRYHDTSRPGVAEKLWTASHGPSNGGVYSFTAPVSPDT